MDSPVTGQLNGQVNPQQQELLQQLKDVSLPDSPGWWPPAPGWWLLLLAVFIVAATVFWLIKKRAARDSSNAWRRSALQEHNGLRHSILNGEDQTGVIAQLSVLMRRVALAVEPRGRIASLTDDQWLEKLDAIGGTSEYTTGVGRVLYRHQYQRTQLFDEETVTDLFKLTGETIKNASPAAQAGVHQSEGGSVAAL